MAYLKERVVSKHASYLFAVKDQGWGPVIYMEPRGGEPICDRPLSSSQLASFELRSGISEDEAQHIADLLNENVETFGILTFLPRETNDRSNLGRDHQRRRCRGYKLARRNGGSSLNTGHRKDPN